MQFLTYLLASLLTYYFIKLIIIQFIKLCNLLNLPSIIKLVYFSIVLINL